jgi:hypothetical protein
MSLPVPLPGNYILNTVGSSGEHYEQPTITFTCTEAESEAFIARCQSLMKWNYKQTRHKVRNKRRAERNGAWELLSMREDCADVPRVERQYAGNPAAKPGGQAKHWEWTEHLICHHAGTF